MPAPIALFAYRRPELLQRTVAALLVNPEAADSDLYVFSDGPRDADAAPGVAAVRQYLRTVTGFRSVTIAEAPVNRGLARSIISGVTAVVSRHGRVVVVEDDLVTSRHFLRYMNQALDLYAETDEVISIHAYVYPCAEPLPETFFLRGADCWGWGTWKRGWNLFEPDGTKLLARLRQRRLVTAFDFAGTHRFSAMLAAQAKGRLDSWAVRWYASAFLANKLTLYPGRPLVTNIGLAAQATHPVGDAATYTGGFRDDNRIALAPLAPVENLLARQAFTTFFRAEQRASPFWQRLRTKLERAWVSTT